MVAHNGAWTIEACYFKLFLVTCSTIKEANCYIGMVRGSRQGTAASTVQSNVNAIGGCKQFFNA
jgi:hypothetical protein